MQQRRTKINQNVSDGSRAAAGQVHAVGTVDAVKNDLSAKIAQSARMVAQRRRLHANFGPAIQRVKMDKEAPLQGKSVSWSRDAEHTAGNPPANETGMPDSLKAGIESLSGFDMSDVRVHANSDKPGQLNALAYAQRRVRPTMQMKSGVQVNNDHALEREADVMGARAASGFVECSTLPQPIDAVLAAAPAGPVQRTVRIGEPNVVIYRPRAKNHPEQYAKDPRFLALVNDGRTFEFATIAELDASLVQWGNDPEQIPEALNARIRQIPSTYSAQTLNEPVSASLDNCGNTTRYLIGRINDASGKKVTLYFDRTYVGRDDAKAFSSDLVANETVPVIMRVVIDTGIHEFTLEKLGDRVVMQQGYQGNVQFSAIWWGDVESVMEGPAAMKEKRATFGGGKVFPVGMIADPLAKFLACDRYFESVDVWKTLPFPEKDQQIQRMFTDREKKVNLKLEKYRIPREAAELPGQGDMMTKRVIAEAKHKIGGK